MSVDSHEKLFIHHLKDLYSAENQLIKALPKVIKAVNQEAVKQALTKHLGETKEHAKRLEKILSDLDYGPTGVKCVGMEGLIKEGDEMMSEKDLPKDLLTETLVEGGQKIENYEIVAYTGAIHAARELGHEDAARLLSQSLQEEENALKTMQQLSSAEPSMA